MDKNPYDIADLIIRYLQGKLTPEEEQDVNRLISEDQVLRKLMDQYRNTTEVKQRLAFLGKLDKEKAWKDVIKKTGHVAPKTKRIWIPYAAAIALIAAMLIWWRPTAQNERVVNDPSYGYANDVLPGTAQAELILSDGKRMKLGETRIGVNEHDGTQLVSEQGELRYTPTEAKNTEHPLVNTLKVPEAGTYRIRLPDGSTVWLNALSELEFPVRFSESERTVYLKGEAFFEVAHNPAQPFNVITDGGEVNVLGTAFNVDAYATDATTTALVSGKVIVKAKSGKKAILHPRQQAVANEHAISVQVADVEKITAWKNGYFHFRHDGLEDIMHQISRWYGVKVSYRSKIPKENYGGTVSRQATLAEVLEMLKDISGLSFEIDGMTVFVTN
jgi:Fe2+-dicitrate sensor, membrane component